MKMSDPNNLRKVLFVDDQWCKEQLRCIILSDYGQLEREGYNLLYETAFDGLGYSTQKVVDTINQHAPIFAVISDMNFTDGLSFGDPNYNTCKRFGRTLLARLKQEFPSLPVIIHSSEEDKGLVQQCLDLGALAWLPKKATYDKLKSTLRELGERK